MVARSLFDKAVYAFRDLFDSQNFALICTRLLCVILCESRHTVSGIYLVNARAYPPTWRARGADTQYIPKTAKWTVRFVKY